MATSTRKPKRAAAKPGYAGKPKIFPVEDASAARLWRSKTLLDRPGFLVRRLYQIHVALFVEECAGEAITPIQYSVMAALQELGTVDQTTLSRATALERTNVADVILRLKGRGLVKRTLSPNDQRMAMAGLTDQGRALLKRIARASARAHERTIAGLQDADRDFLLDALQMLVDAHDGGPISTSKE
ncbi:MarR family transcriptional regulator [soil metagenome]